MPAIDRELRWQFPELPEGLAPLRNYLDRELGAVLRQARNVINSRFGSLVTLSDASFPYTVKLDDEVLIATVLGTPKIMFLPDPRGYWRHLVVKKTGAGDIELTPPAGVLIDGLSAYTLTGAGSFVRVLSDQSNFWTV